MTYADKRMNPIHFGSDPATQLNSSLFERHNRKINKNEKQQVASEV